MVSGDRGPDSDENPQLTPLHRALVAIEQMEAKLDAAQRARHEPVAIVGIGCRFPGGADGPDAFWELLRRGDEAVIDVPADRWDIDSLYDPDPDAPGKMSTRRGGFLVEDVGAFDPQFFGIAPREAASMDPQQRLLLEVAWEALEHAGIAADRLAGSRTGVFIGMTSDDYSNVLMRAAGLSGLDAYYTSGIARSIASGRISYLLGFEGPSITVDTACSSSLVAAHLAVQSLRAEECGIALAGGVNLILSPENSVMLSKYHMMAPDGRCKAFDASADGFVRGEGCGLVVLKRLRDALADGDDVIAVIRGSAVNQDGSSSGLTAPNGPSQEALLRDALADAGVASHEVGYVEAHGTGTALGDPIEVQALAAALGPGRDDDAPLAIGSVKTNVGHLEAVAGVAGLIKAALVVQRGEIPPHLHLEEPNPHIDWPSLPVEVPTGGRPWRPDRPRIAGVSAFGFSGTNAHLLLEQPPTVAPSERDDRPAHLLALSARSASALRELAGRYVAVLDAGGVSMGDLCASANIGRAQLAHRAAFVAGSPDELREQLASFAAGADAVTGVVTGAGVGTDPRKIGFLFTGQGSQYVGMAQGLYAVQPVFRAALDRVAELMAPSLPEVDGGGGLLSVLFADEGSEAAGLLGDTAWTQPGLFAVEWALAELWGSWGVAPQVLLGHSVGELVASVMAGVLTLEDGVRLVCARGRLMGALPPGGAMLAVFAGVVEVEPVVAEVVADGGVVSVAAVNGPAHVVVSGAAAGVGAVAAVFEDRGVRVQKLVVSHGFHSPLMEPMLDEFGAVAESIDYDPPRRRLISNVTGEPMGAELATAEHWRRHVMAPVQFARGVESMRALGVDTFVEIGPHPVLLGMGRECLAAGEADGAIDATDPTDPTDPFAWVPSLRRSRDDWRQVLDGLAALYVAGVDVDWQAFEAPYDHRRIPLPTYPFERQRHWIRQRRIVDVDEPAGHPLLGRRLRSPLSTVTFEAHLAVDTVSYLDDHRVFETAILPATGFIETALAAAGEFLGDERCELDDIVIHEAFVADDDLLHTLQTVLDPDDDGARFTIYGQADGDARWATHASGRLRRASSPSAAAVDVDLLRARCADDIDAAAHYALLTERGLVFGPSLRGVQRIWVGEGEAVGELALPEVEVANLGRYRVHPALLDAAIQVLAEAAGGGDHTYLPISIDRLTTFGAATERAWSHVVLRPGGVPSGQVEGSGPAETMTADVSLYAIDGAPIAVLEGLHLKRADRNALLRLGRRGDPDDWLYTVAWRELPAATSDEAREALPFPLPTELAAAAGEHVDRLRETHDLDHYQGLLDELEALSTDYIIAALDALGVRFEADHHFSLDALGVAEQHRALLGELADFLADDGILAADGEGWRVLRAVVVDVGEERWSALLERYPLGRGELTVTRRCGEQLAGALTGEVDHLQLIFPGGSLDAAEDMYQLSPFAHFFNSLLSESIAEAVGQSGASRPDPGRPLRVIEIGAGTGGTTSYVLPRLPADNTEYTYTDISPHFLTRAREKFAAHPFVEYRTLDIEGDLGAQGFDGERYDVVVAANVLHATADLRHTFANVARLLAPGGLLAMVEMVRPQRFISITFGLTEGWWKFTDRALRPSSLLLDRDGWRDFLADQGFVDPRGIPAIGADAPSALAVQAALLAAAPPVDDARQVLPPERRRWLVVGDRGGVGDRFAESIRARGGSAVVGVAGERFRDLGDDRFELDPADPDDWARLVAQQPDGAADGFPDGVVHLWSLDEPAPDAAASATMERRLGSALLLARTLVEAGASTHLWLVTRGAQAAGDVAPDAEQAPLWGFAKALALEHPELHAACLDLDPSPVADPASALLDEVLTTDAEDQVAVRGRARLGARLVRWTPPGPAMARELTFDEGGALDLLLTREIERRSPGPDEVEIRVHATGLNFKDVLNVLGMYPGDPGPLGGECAGVVVAVGSEVTDVSVGDAVVAVASGSFRSHVTCPATFVAPKPPEMSFAEAAALLIANVTAEFALRHVGRIAPGERVLIHAAAGGVGLAAVDLARRAGAEIFATAGSDEKRAFLARLGVEHIYDSRSLDFADAIATETGGEGVDLVLNSLAGDFVPHSMALLRDGGRFLEIGKSDHLDGDAAQRLGRGIEYHVIDWGETSFHDPQLIASIVSDVVSAAADGVSRPLPIEVFPLAEAEAAFRFMAQARHIGKVVVTQPEAATERTPAPIVADATYLVTGGLTGLGLLTAQHLCERGARHLALIGRRPPSESAQAQIAAMEADGVRVEVVQGDVSVRADLARALDIVDSAMPPLRGVFHSAGALDDAGLTQQTWERFATVLRAKIDGARLLEELTAGDQIDHFVLYSSIASLLGSRGQTNHAAANAYLDALAHRRAALGRHGLSINWGAWDEIGAAVERGVVERTEERGIGIIPPDDGLAILDRLMDGAVPQVGVSPLDWSVVLQTSRPGGPPPYLADHMAAARAHTVAQSPAPVADIGAKLQAAPPHRRHAMLLEFVREQSAHVLALSPDDLDARTPLGDLGLDSLMAVELRNSLGASLSMDRPIPATLVFDYPTIEAITDFLAGPVLDSLVGDERDGDDGDGLHGDVEAPAPVAGTSPGSSLETLFDDMENLSDEEIDRRLAERSGT